MKFDKVNSEAIYELHYQEDMRAKGIPYQVSNLVIYTAISALEKQIPKKPKPHIVQPVEAPIQIGNGRWQKGTTVYKCLNCKEWVSKTYKHCPNCGQALKWSDSK